MRTTIMTGSGRVAPSGEFLSATVLRADGGWFAHSPARVNIKHGGETIRWMDAKRGQTINQRNAPDHCPSGIYLELFGKPDAIAEGQFEIEVVWR